MNADTELESRLRRGFHAAAATIPPEPEAVDGAVDKLIHALDHTLGRLSDRGGHVPMSGEQT